MSDWRSDPNGFNEIVIHEFRANGGVVGGKLAGIPLLLLTTIDARSGQPRTTPLVYHRRGNRYLVIASNGGAARDPAWFRNLERDPSRCGRGRRRNLRRDGNDPRSLGA